MLMTIKKVATAAVLLTLIISPVNAGEKATDLMSLALKNKAAGKTGLAIDQLEKAVERSQSALQKQLALFMLGDCQLESGRYSHAAKTFEHLRNNANDSEAQAEATYRLLQAETFLKNRKKAARLYGEIKKSYRSSPYYELAKAFVNAQNISQDIEQPELKKSNNRQKIAEQKVDKKEKEPAVAISKKQEAEPKPIEVNQRTEEKVAQKPTVRSAPATSDKKQAKAATKASQAQADLLKDALTITTNSSKDNLVSEILSLQDSLKTATSGQDQILFELAGKTLEFGETLEACKIYDQILNQHPTSAYVEQSYYESIRLRAILGVHEAVISWAKAFLAAFPASRYAQSVKALLFYSENNGQIDYSGGVANNSTATDRLPKAAEKDDSERLKKDSNYLQATRKMKDGKYNLALIDLKNLAKQYPAASQIWWDLALVHVQCEDFPEAEKAVKKMLRINPDNEEGNSLLGYIHYRLEDYQQAASAYDRAGEAGGNGVNFFDPKRAAERMKKSVNAGQ
jgi:tetratricopeptide (TPR) repeat protein